MRTGIGLALRAALAALALPGVIGGLVPWLILGRALDVADPPARLTASLLVMSAGIALLVWCIVLFAIDGRGTLAPVDPPTVVVARGPYRFTRNPMYVGVTTWLTGVAVLTASRPLAWYALVVAVAFHLRVVLNEEPVMRRRFGAPYDAYCARVPRWLWPRRGTRDA